MDRLLLVSRNSHAQRGRLYLRRLVPRPVQLAALLVIDGGACLDQIVLGAQVHVAWPAAHEVVVLPLALPA